MIVRRVVGVDPAGGIKHPRDHRVTTHKSQCHATREMAHGAGGAVRQHGRAGSRRDRETGAARVKRY